MILVDSNLLLYAVNQDLPVHEEARTWLETVFSSGGIVGLPWVVLLGFLRVSTNPRVFKAPLSVEVANDYISEWTSIPTVRLISPGPGHWSILSQLLKITGTAGNLTTDAHIASLAIEHGATVCSADNDFRRFVGVNYLNPLTHQGGPTN